MVQPNYSPEEALNRVKLMMKYDSSKTLNENVSVIFEQSQSCSPAINETELDGIVNEVWGMLDKMTTIFSQAVYVEERAGKVYNNINKLVGKKYFDDISKECVSAKAEFLERFKVRSNKGGVILSTEGDIIKLIDEALGETGVENSVKAQKYLNAAKKILSTEDSSVPTTDTVNKKDGVKTSKTGGGYKACSGMYNMGCIADSVSKIQGCLGLVPDGKYGPKTNAKLKEIGYNSFTDNDVTKICGTKTTTQPDAQTTKPDDIEQVDAEDSTDLLK